MGLGRGVRGTEAEWRALSPGVTRHRVQAGRGQKRSQRARVSAAESGEWRGGGFVG